MGITLNLPWPEELESCLGISFLPTNRGEVQVSTHCCVFCHATKWYKEFIENQCVCRNFHVFSSPEIGYRVAAIYPKHKLVVMQMPKTGCIWRIQALHSARVGRPQRVKLPVEHDNRHAVLDQLPSQYLSYKKIGCIRRPDHWIRSWWMMRMQRGNWSSRWPTWMPDVFWDRDCRSTNFEIFVKKYLEFYPGFVSRLTSDYVGHHGSGVDCVCRVENLVPDLCNALTKLKIPYDEVALKNSPKVNTGRAEWKSMSELSDDIRTKIFEAEAEIMERFYPNLWSRTELRFGP